jgi:rare lipoprotein A
MPNRILAALALACVIVVPAHAQTCRASWYSQGYRTANGERFHPEGLTAASRTLPFNTRVRVTLNGRSVVVRISDRGPAAWTHRCIDLSRGGARAIGLVAMGVATVKIEVVG